MAEGLAREFYGIEVSVQSAGSLPSSVNPLAIQVMRELGIDISRQTSKSVDIIDAGKVDTVVTLCAEEVCPLFLGHARHEHWPIRDPATCSGDELKRRSVFREVRDEISNRIKDL